MQSKQKLAAAAAAALGLGLWSGSTFAGIRPLAPGEEIVYQTVQANDPVAGTTNYRSSFSQITGNAYSNLGDEILLGGSNRYITNIAVGTQTYFNVNTPAYMDGVNSQPPTPGYEDTGGFLQLSIYLNDGPIDSSSADPFVEAGPTGQVGPGTLVAKVRVPTPVYPQGGVSQNANGFNNPDDASDNAADPWIVEFPLANVLVPERFTFSLVNLNASGVTDGYNFDGNQFGLWHSKLSYGTLAQTNTDPDANPATFNNGTFYNTNLVGQSRTGPFVSASNNGHWAWLEYNGPRVSPTPWESSRDANEGVDGTMYALGATVAATFYWDTDGFDVAGAGGTAPSGNWSDTALNWNSNSAGSGPGMIKGKTTAGDTVVFSGGGAATGSYTVTVSGTQSAAAVNVEEGDVTFAGAGTVSTPAVNVASGATGTVTATLTGPSASITKTGAGTLQVSKLPQSNAMTISAGTVRVLESAPGVSSGHPAGDDAFVSRPSSLSIADGATLDITNNDVVIDYSGSSPLAAYEALVASGYNLTGDWQGDGIVSSIAANDGNYVVAIADNATLAAPYGTAQGGPLFAGVDVDLDTILIKFTHRADINLDGVMSPDDSAVFGGNYDEGQPAVWATGDMNYDGIFTPDDAAIFGGAYDESLNSLPEPGIIGLFGFAAVASLRRRRIAGRP